ADPEAEAAQIRSLKAWREARDAEAVQKALAALEAAARSGANIMEPSIACAHAGVTTGEWGATLRRVFGEYRAPTGVAGAATQAPAEEEADALAPVRPRGASASRRLGRRLAG